MQGVPSLPKTTRPETVAPGICRLMASISKLAAEVEGVIGDDGIVEIGGGRHQPCHAGCRIRRFQSFSNGLRALNAGVGADGKGLGGAKGRTLHLAPQIRKCPVELEMHDRL